MTLLRTGIHGHSGPGVIPVSQMVSGALGGPPWWNPDGATPGLGGSCVGAYRAIDTAGSPWGPGPANYAASLVNLANPGVNNLIEGNGAVPWAGATGWGFVAAAVQYFNTGILPLASYSILIQYANVIGTGFVAGSFGGAVSQFRFRPNTGAAVFYSYGVGTALAPNLLTGNIGIVGIGLSAQPYRNGIADGPIILGTPAGAPAIYAGCFNNAGVAQNFITADIESFAIYDVTLTAPQVLTRATAMAAL